MLAQQGAVEVLVVDARLHVDDGVGDVGVSNRRVLEDDRVFDGRVLDGRAGEHVDVVAEFGVLDGGVVGDYLSAFEGELDGEWAGDAGEDVLDDMGEEAKDRLSDLGYIE